MHHKTESIVSSLFMTLVIAGITAAIIGLVLDGFTIAPNNGTSLYIMLITAVFLVISFLANKAPRAVCALSLTATIAISIYLVTQVTGTIDPLLSTTQLVFIIVYMLLLTTLIWTALSRQSTTAEPLMDWVEAVADGGENQPHTDSRIVRRSRNRRDRNRSRLTTNVSPPRYRG